MVQPTASLADRSVTEPAIQEFAGSLGGELLRPGEPAYEEARQVYNAMIDKRPALIARCAGVADVMSAVAFGRAYGMEVAVRAGGHNVAGNSLCDGGLVIDLSRMKGIRVDPAGRTVRAQAGCTFADLDRETQAFGLATTGGVISTTGIAGLTLGGGIGWLMRKHGLVCDNLLSADVVTADGQLLTASGTENADLFWGLRGGGGNFGVVTSFEYRLHPVGPVLGGMIVHPMERATDVLRFYRDFARQAPEELGTVPVLLTGPDGGPMMGVLVCYNGDLSVGERVLRPLREFGPPVADGIEPMAYRQIQSMLDEGFPPGLHNYWKSAFLTGLDDSAIDTVVKYAQAATSPLSAIAIEHFGGAVARVDPGATAFTQRDAEYNLLIMARWTDPTEAHRHIAWARELFDAMRPYSAGGAYVNYLEEGKEGADRIRESYGPNYDRLVALKTRYDPANFFHRNQNIRPTA